MAASGVVKIDDVEFRLDLVMLSVLEQMVVGYLREVRKFVVVDIHSKGFLDLLFDVVVHHGIALSGAGCSQYDRGSERVHDVDPAVPFLTLIDKFRGQVYGILVFHKPCFLHETFVGGVEYVFHKVVLQHTADPYSRHKQENVARGKRQRIYGSIHCRTERKVKHPPVHEEQDDAAEEGGVYFPPRHLLVLDTFRTQTRKSQKYEGEHFRHEQVAEQSCRLLEVQQNPVHDSNVDAHIHECAVAEPVDMDYNKHDGNGTHELHDLGQSSQIIFLLHNCKNFDGW